MNKTKNLRLLAGVGFMFVSILLASCTGLMQQKVSMNTSSQGLTSKFSASSENALDTPQNVTVSQNYSKDTIRIRWSAVDNAAYYSLTRAILDPTTSDTSVPDESAYKPFTYNNGNSSQYIEGTSLDDVVIDLEALEMEAASSDTAVAVNQIPEYKNNYRYFYRVVAKNPGEGFSESDPSEIDENVYGTLYKPADNLRASAGVSTSYIELSWDAVENTSNYLIYRTEESNGQKSALVSTIRGNITRWKDTVTSDRQGTQYYYKVIPVSKSGEQAVESSLAMGYALTAGAPGAPAITGVSRGTEKTITLTWNGVSASTSAGAVIAESSMLYDVYRSTSADSTIKKVATTAAGVTTYKETTTQTKNPLQYGVYYYYFILPYYLDPTSGAKVLGSMTQEKTEGFLLSAPASLSASKDTSGNHVIKFQESIGNETERAMYVYKLYGSTTADGTYSLVNGNINNTKAENGYISVKVNNPSTKFYYITVNYNNIESYASNTVEPIPSRVQNIYATRNGFAANGQMSPYDRDDSSSSRSNAYGCLPIFITWDPSEYDDAEGYNVYASTDPQKGYVKINSSVIPKGTNYFEDKRDDVRPLIPVQNKYTGYVQPKKNKLYSYTFWYYVVQPVNSLGQGEVVTTLAKDGEYNWGYAALDRQTFLLVYDVSNLYSQARSKYLSQEGGLAKMPNGMTSTQNDKEYIYGLISGQLEYSAAVSMSPLGAKIWMHFTNYCDFGVYMPDGNTLPITFHNGDTNTVAKADHGGNMNGTMILANCVYTGQIEYGQVVIVNEKVGGGSFGLKSGPYSLVYDDWTVSTGSLTTW